ncbi:uncharacterized protein FOMMEDRAFT_141222 [Fomitiporia mediterranea MF3/22]|uniref:uncharacterized protein n=1 Tax=Fomitiporia mediterranea (strain MF3/22) TaxID=694068 RepID=UPI00044077F5|nr:uncharacterized protein FOMMEDRAFT_141222 [Fomitiporia mediterranea MF3/22]EJD02038.1 hypothetical protein FOMMEDRAFT_141222 [Fomitiporia mediterranea MF3/22]
MPRCTIPQRQRRWWLAVPTQLALAAVSVALPLEPRQVDHQQSQSNNDTMDRDNSPPNLGNNISPKVWAPAVAVVLVLLGVFCFVWTRTSVVSRLRGVAARAGQNGTSATREVTASQLAGGTTTSRRTVGTRNPRTGRRNRRTPSQISTTSLPVYMKEPGDQELVIFRGPEALDASDAIAEAREAEDQDDEHGHDSDSIGIRDSQAGMLVLDPNHDPPTAELRPDESAMSLGVGGEDDGNSLDPDTSTTELLPRGHHHQRNDSGDTSDSRSVLTRPMSDVPSDAPPDYDFGNHQRDSTSSAGIEHPPGLTNTSVTDSSNSNASAEPERTSSPPTSVPPSSSPLPTHPSTPEPARIAGGRRSRLASRVSNLLHLRNGSINESSASLAADAGADESARVSVVSVSVRPAAPNEISLNEAPAPQSPTSSSYPPVTQQQQSRHRHSSSSTSTLPIPFRTLSRQRSRSSTALTRQRSNATLSSHNPAASRSNVNLTSPSALSLSLSLAQGANPISPPLSHTLVRTEIRYPPSGPTPEQVKFLSARDGFGRFGLPYGDEAVAHAQSSRLELPLESPPPAFESPIDEVGASAARAAREINEAREIGNNRRSEDEHHDDDDDGDDPDAFIGARDTENSSSMRSRSAEALAAETRILMPLFM